MEQALSLVEANRIGRQTGNPGHLPNLESASHVMVSLHQQNTPWT